MAYTGTWVGRRLHAKWRRGTDEELLDYYPGKIARVHDHAAGLYDVEFDDKHMELSVRRQDIIVDDEVENNNNNNNNNHSLSK